MAILTLLKLHIGTIFIYIYIYTFLNNRREMEMDGGGGGGEVANSGHFFVWAKIEIFRLFSYRGGGGGRTSCF